MRAERVLKGSFRTLLNKMQAPRSLGMKAGLVHTRAGRAYGSQQKAKDQPY